MVFHWIKCLLNDFHRVKIKKNDFFVNEVSFEKLFKVMGFTYVFENG